MCGRAEAGFRPMPLTDAFEIIRAEVRNHRIFATFGTLNPLKLQAQQSYFPPIVTPQVAVQVPGPVMADSRDSGPLWWTCGELTRVV